jgi:hypothetical protein
VDRTGQRPQQDHSGNQIELGVDTANLHFFDADSGLAVGHPHAGQAPC